MRTLITISLISALGLLTTHCDESAMGTSDSESAFSPQAMDPNGGTNQASGAGSAGLAQAGAQDFGLFRQILDQGDVPAPGTLDDLGFFAEHKIDYPDADCGQDVCIHTLLGVTGNMITGSNCTLVQLGLNTPIDPATIERPPLHLVLAVDQGASMAGAPITFVKAGLDRMLDALMPEDKISLVTYSNTAHVVLQEVPATDFMTLVNAFDGIKAIGSSNLYDGMFTAFSVAKSAQDIAWQNRVILLSDGIANVGITQTAKMVSLARAYAKEGIGITTIGIGNEFNIDVMRSVAEVGAGNFYFLENPESVKEVFTDEVKTFLYPVATQVEIDVSVGAGYTIGRVYGTHGWVGDATGGRIEIPTLFLAGRTDASAPIEEGRRGGGGAIIFELLPLPGGEALPDPYDVLTVDIDWKDPRAGTTLGDVFPVTNPALPGVVQQGGYFDNFTVEKGFVMVNILVGFEIATAFAAEGDYGSALAVLKAMHPALEGWLADNPDPDLQDDLGYVDLFIQNLEDTVTGINIQMPAGLVEPWPAGD
jgi:Ca-activated chloride channel homolog